MTYLQKYTALFKEKPKQDSMSSDELRSLEYINANARLISFSVKYSLITSLFLFMPILFLLDKYVDSDAWRIFIALLVFTFIAYGLMRMFWTSEAHRLGITYKEIQKEIQKVEKTIP